MEEEKIVVPKLDSPDTEPKQNEASVVALSASEEREAKLNEIRLQNKINKKGAFVTALVCAIIAIGLVVASYFVIGAFFTTLYENGTDSASFFFVLLAFIIFMFTYGLATFMPALILTIVSMVMSIRCWSSPVKAYKVWGIIIFVVSLLLLIAVIGVVAAFMIFASTGSA